MSFSSNVCSNVVLQSSDRTEIFATAVGNPNNPPIVFVHGYTYSALVFEDLFCDEQLLERYYMVAYDLRGHGRSGKPTTLDSYASNLFADDFAVVINHFKITSPLFVGWSYGGTVMTDIFSHLPPLTISGIFGITAIPALHPELLVQTPLTTSLLPLFDVTDNLATSVDAKVAFFDGCFNDPSSLPIQLKWSWFGCSMIQLPPVPLTLLARKQNVTKLLEAGRQGFPYLALHGTADKLLYNEDILKGLLPHFTNLEVHRVEGGSHTPFVKNKDEFIRVFISFADKVFRKGDLT